MYDGAHHIRLHLARPNPIWQALTENTRCMFTVVAPFTYVPTSWEAPPGTAPEWGIPTSHYATVQLRCTARITDDEAEIRRVLAEQLRVMQPDEPYGDPTSPDAPYRTELRQIRGLELTIDAENAKLKSTAAKQTTFAPRSSPATPNDKAQVTPKPTTTSAADTHHRVDAR